jgi:hypothetical protein
MKDVGALSRFEQDIRFSMPFENVLLLLKGNFTWKT